MTLKVVLVGCGKIADGHVEEIQKLHAIARVTAVCDLEPLMAEQIAVRYGIPNHYSRFEQMLDKEKPDVVHITTPPQSHLPLAKTALDAGCHIYVEKPLTLHYADARQLVEYATQANRKLTIGYSNLFDPAALAMRELIRNGVLGDPIHVESFYGYNLAGPFGAAIMSDAAHWVHRLPGKLFHNNIDHLLHKVTEFIDDESPCIKATAYVRREQHYGDDRDNLQDELRVMIHGQRTSAYATFSSHIRPAGQFARVYGTRNTLDVDYLNRTVTLATAPELPSAIGRLLPPFQDAWQFARAGQNNLMRFLRSDFHYFAGMNRLFALFYASIIDQTPVPVPYRDILRISAMMEEIFRQIEPQTEQQIDAPQDRRTIRIVEEREIQA